MPGSTLARTVGRWLLGAGLALGAGACSGAHEPAQRSPETTQPRAVIKPTADVPALLGHSIDELRRRLGPAQELPAAFGRIRQDSSPYPSDSAVMFRTGGLQLIASYDIRTRVISDLLLLGRHEDSLMHRAALRADARNYLVLPVFQANRPGLLLGLRVIPASRE